MNRTTIITAVTVAATVAGAVLAGTGTAAARPYDYGCETISGWQGGIRTLCDGPREADGGWMRTRRLWTSEHYVPSTSYCGDYSCSFTGGYTAGESTRELMTYRVYDNNVLSDEPGWLPEHANTILSVPGPDPTLAILGVVGGLVALPLGLAVAGAVLPLLAVGSVSLSAGV